MGCMLFSTDLRLSTDGLYTVGCPSNGRRASSISALPAPAAQTSAGGTGYSLLPAAGCAAAQASQSDLLDKSQKTRLAIFRKNKTIGLVWGKHKREGWPEWPAQPSWHRASASKTN